MSFDRLLSPNFTLSEFAQTSHRRYQEANWAHAEACEGNLTRLCLEILEPLRAELGCPIIVTSGVRCPRLNKAVRGSRTSQHLRGSAVDIRVPGVPLNEVWYIMGWLMDLPFSQVILEGWSASGPSWLHIGLIDNQWDSTRGREVKTADLSRDARGRLRVRYKTVYRRSLSGPAEFL